jgi:hypothetical protein
VATSKTILRDTRLPSEPPQPVRVQDALATIADSASYVEWKDAQVAGAPGVIKSIVEAWRDREDWRAVIPVTYDWAPPSHGEVGDDYLARIIELVAPAETTSPAELATVTAAAQAYVLSVIGDPDFADYAWFWSGACAFGFDQFYPETLATSGQWVSSSFAFKGYGAEDDPVYCPML